MNTVYSKNVNQGGDDLKQWTIRMPEELLTWLRERAAKETIKRDRNVSMNTLAVDIIMKAMRADRKKSR